ncbi:MAG: 50S ribosome-binding GTPase, partial [Deltaproteobacteria bacterium]|nr:50S ribosome-binding GTPase [Deltaproteobacteria bacterium]
TDTVGFISDMPRELMKAFKATLEEMQDANLLIHVVDITDTQMDENIRTVENVLNDLGLISIPTLMVMNKVDMIDKIEAMNICERLNALGVSALKAETLKPLVKKLEANLFPEKLKTGDG